MKSWYWPKHSCTCPSLRVSHWPIALEKLENNQYKNPQKNVKEIVKCAIRQFATKTVSQSPTFAFAIALSPIFRVL